MIEKIRPLFIALSVIFISGVFTGAYFSDRVSTTNNTFSAGTWSVTPSATATPAPARVVINEVLYAPSGPDPNGEWVEIYNAGGTAVDLSGYVLSDGEGTLILPSFTLNPNSYAVYAKDAATFTANYGFAPNFSGSSIALGNDGDELALYNASSTLVDSVAWEGGVFPGIVPHPGVSEGHSIARSPDGKDTDDCSVDFVDKAPPLTPGGSNV